MKRILLFAALIIGGMWLGSTEIGKSWMAKVKGKMGKPESDPTKSTK